MGATVEKIFSNLYRDLRTDWISTTEFKETCFFGVRAGLKRPNKGSDKFLKRGFLA